MAATVYGIELDRRLGSIDMLYLAGAGLDFVYCKASESANLAEKSFATYMAQGVQARSRYTDFYLGAFHVGRPDLNPGRSGGEKEALFFCETVAQSALKFGFSYAEFFLPPAVEVTCYSDYGYPMNREWLMRFLEVCEQELGRSCVVKTNDAKWLSEFGNTDEFRHVPLWQVSENPEGWHHKVWPPRIPSQDYKKIAWDWTFWTWGTDAGTSELSQKLKSSELSFMRLNGSSGWLQSLAKGDVRPISKTTSGSNPALLGDLNLDEFVHTKNNSVRRVQGLLLSHGYGPEGLVNSEGHPDGKMGTKTSSYLKHFKAKHGFASDCVVDWPTWWALLQP